jgi:poly(3-hydroxybutyrate) depolymerase
MIRLKVTLCVLFAAFLFQGFAKPADSCLAGSTKMSDGGTMVFRLYVPRHYTTQYKYPLVMALHGIGECGTDDSIQVDHEYMTNQWMLDSVKSKYQPFVLYPQCPSSSYEWGYWNTGTAAQKGYAGVPAVAAVKVIDSLIKVYPIDTTRLYIGGLSWGGLGTQALMMSYRNKFAAAFPCAGENWLDSVLVMTKTPFWIFHGLADGTVPVTPDTNFVTAVIKSGIPVVKFYSSLDANFHVTTVTGVVSTDSLTHAVVNGSKYLGSFINGGNHNSGWDEAFFHPLLVPWLMSKSRVNGQMVFTWPAPGPASATSVTERPASPAAVSGPLQIAGGMIRWKDVSRLPFRLDIYAANGSLVKRYEICQGEGTLDCSGLTKGVYFVTIDAQNRSARMMAISENRR